MNNTKRITLTNCFDTHVTVDVPVADNIIYIYQEISGDQVIDVYYINGDFICRFDSDVDQSRITGYHDATCYCPNFDSLSRCVGNYLF